MSPEAASTRATVLQVLHDVFEDFGEGDTQPEWHDETVLLEAGLDSLAFAVVVTELEDRLGIDPFTEAEDPVYPATVREFVAIYEAAVPQA